MPNKIYIREKLLFIMVLISFAFFHQGGGWNQNARFAMVRAMVEKGTFSIDAYLIYAGKKTSDGSSSLFRLPVHNGEVVMNGKAYSLAWTTPDRHLIPVNGSYTRPEGLLSVEQISTTGDVAFYNGQFHPNKAPGASFLAVPAYFILYQIEQFFGLNTDNWWILTVNFWLTAVFSVGLISAAGCIIFYRCARLICNGYDFCCLLATCALAFGSLFFPNATILYEHNMVGVLLLASFYMLYKTKGAWDVFGDNILHDTTHANKQNQRYVFLSGLCAGCAAITSYIAAVIVLLLALYLILISRKRNLLFFGLGLLGPFVLLCMYNIACFGIPFTTNYSYENPLFQKQGTVARLFSTPQWEVLLLILCSPFRGLFFYSPVVMLAVPGVVCLFHTKRTRTEAWLILAVFCLFLLFNISFNAWHGGWCIGPRYLVPALPFLMLPAAIAFNRFFKTSCVIAIISIAITVVCTAVDPQPPVGNSIIAKVPGQSVWQTNPLTQYELPLFFAGKAWPILQAQREAKIMAHETTLAERGLSAKERQHQLTVLGQQWQESVMRGDAKDFLLSTVHGPVSANPIGCYEGWYYRVYNPHSVESQWNSFNLGEFLFPHSRMSLLPLLLIWCGSSVMLFRTGKNS
jgi:hypothetical protein